MRNKNLFLPSKEMKLPKRAFKTVGTLYGIKIRTFTKKWMELVKSHI